MPSGLRYTKTPTTGFGDIFHDDEGSARPTETVALEGPELPVLFNRACVHASLPTRYLTNTQSASQLLVPLLVRYECSQLRLKVIGTLPLTVSGEPRAMFETEMPVQ